MIIPIGHESNTVKRIPWITFVIMAICLVVQISTSSTMNEIEYDLEYLAQDLFEFYLQRPYLELSPELIKTFELDSEENQAIIERNARYGRRKPDSLTVADEQQELDKLTRELLDLIKKIPYIKWGYIPVKKSFVTLITHMFFHGGWLHLIGNLLFLYLTGPFIEDVWGRPVYIVFYLLVGMFAAEMYALQFPGFKGPLIGASGAIAGAMGAFMIRYFKTKIRFFYFVFPLTGTFRAPAWLMMPLWVVFEIMNARLLSTIKSDGGGVAHHAHIAGFVLGALIALVFKIAKIEEKYLKKKIEKDIFFEDQGFKISEEALALWSAGRKDKAFEMLKNGSQKFPDHPEITVSLWESGQELGQGHQVKEPFKRLIEKEVRQGRIELAAEHYRQLQDKFPEDKINNISSLKLTEFWQAKGELKTARDIFKKFAGNISARTPPGLLLLLLSSDTLNLDYSLAKNIIKITLDHADIPADKKELARHRLEQILSKEKLRSDPVPRMVNKEQPLQLQSNLGETVAHLPVRPQHNKQIMLRISSALLKGVRHDRLILELGQTGRRALPIKNIKAVSRALIKNDQGRRLNLIDLLLDGPGALRSEIRIIRIISNEFEPLEIVPKAETKEQALNVFISFLLRSSGGKKITVSGPDAPGSFNSVIDYEKSLKKCMSHSSGQQLEN